MTKNQSKLLKYIKEFWEENGYCPSYKDMCGAMGMKSRSGIHGMVVSLEARGFITRIPNAARSIQLVEVPKKRKV